MKRLEERLAEVQSRISEVQTQMALLRSKEELLVEMLREAKGEPAAVAPRRRAPRANVKNAVLDFLGRVGSEGLNAAIAVDMAESEGQALDRGSVSSLLSRLKNEGTVTYIGGLYRLVEYSPTEGAPDLPRAQVHPFRTSGAAS